MTPYQQIEELVELGYGISIVFIKDNYLAIAAVQGTQVAVKKSKHMVYAIDDLYEAIKTKHP